MPGVENSLWVGVKCWVSVGVLSQEGPKNYLPATRGPPGVNPAILLPPGQLASNPGFIYTQTTVVVPFTLVITGTIMNIYWALSCARYLCKQRMNAVPALFALINPHTSALGQALTSPLHRQGNKAESYRNLFRVTRQHVAGIQTHGVWFQSISLNYCTALLLFNVGLRAILLRSRGWTR